MSSDAELSSHPDQGHQASSPSMNIPGPVIRVASLGDIKIYQLTEEELDRLAAGSPDSPVLSIALALVSTSVTLRVTLQTATLTSDKHEGFVAAFWVTAVSGGIMLLLWLGRLLFTQRLVAKIKGRMLPTPGEQQPTESVNGE